MAATVLQMFPAGRIGASGVDMEAEFECWWELYPRKRAKGSARLAYAKSRRRVSADVLIDGLLKYRAHVEAESTAEHFICHPATWLNGERWEDEYESTAEPASEEPREDRLLMAKAQNMNRLGRRFPNTSDDDLRRAVEQGWLRKELAEKWL